MTNHIPKPSWPDALQAFTNRNAGRVTILDEQGSDIGAQQAERGYPLRGVSYDHHDQRIEIMLGDLNGTEHHFTRGIPNVTGIDVLSVDGRDAALRIQREDGQTILRFPGA